MFISFQIKKFGVQFVFSLIPILLVYMIFLSIHPTQAASLESNSKLNNQLRISEISIISQSNQFPLIGSINEQFSPEKITDGREKPGNQIRFDKITIDQGLSQNSISSIFQDRNGFLWFGTNDGLNKFDGYEFTIYRHDPDDPTSLSDNSVTSIVEDPNGNLWVGTDGRGLNQFDQVSEKFSHYQFDPENPGSLTHSTVNAISLDTEGRLWVGTSNGLDRFDPAKNSFIHYKNDPDDFSSISSDQITDIHLDKDGVLWIGTSGGGLNRYNPDSDRFSRYRHDIINRYKLSSDDITTISEDQSGNLWIGTRSGGVNFFDKGSEKFYYFRDDYINPEIPARASISSIGVDGEGKIWIGTSGEGIEILNPSTGEYKYLMHNAGDPSSVSSDVITEIFVDPTGIVWVGSVEGGINRFDPLTSRFFHYRHIPNDAVSLSSNNVKSIAEDQAGNYWIGTYGGGIDYFDLHDGRIFHYRNDPDDPYSLSSNNVMDVLIDKSGDIWIATDGGGLNRFSPITGKFTNFLHDPKDADSLSMNDVNVIFQDRDGSIWVGTNGGGLDRFNPRTGKFYHYVNDPDDPSSLSSDEIWTIIEDREGYLWIGTGGGGISILDQDSARFSRILHDPTDGSSLGDNDIYAIYEDDFGQKWIGSNGSGLDKFSPTSGEFTHYREKDGLSNNVIYGILEDQEGYLWLSTNLGLSKFDPETEKFTNFDASDGLQSNEFNVGSSLVAADGLMLFGGINGLSAFYPEDIRETSYFPPILFTGLMQSGNDLLQESSIEDIDPIVLTWGNNNLEFEFVALNMSHPEKSQYSYKLVGFDEDWNFIGNSRSGRYTNLPAGSYTLQIRATNSDGIWNDESTALNIRVIPPFWETWWFIGLVTIAIMGSVIGGYRLRIRSVESRSQELEKQVRMRTEEINRRRLEMESLYEADEIIDQNLTQEGRLRSLVDVSIDLLGADASSILLWDEYKDGFTVIASRGFNSRENIKVLVPGNESAIREAALQGELLIINELSDEYRNAHLGDKMVNFLYDEGIRCSIFLPIIVTNQLFGILNVNYYRADSIGEGELRVFKSLTQHSAISIHNAQLFEQLREVAINDERRRLARDLHDSAKQKAFAALAQLGAAGGIIDQDPTTSKEHLLEAEDLVHEVLQELIILIQEMYPVALREKGLANSVREYVYDWQNQCDIDVSLNIQDERKLPLEIEQSLYRVIQESLANIARHSQAHQVKLDLNYLDEKIIVQISDDGVGFDVQGQQSGLGLRSMQERIDLINGTLIITSIPDEGTMVNLSAPI